MTSDKPPVATRAGAPRLFCSNGSHLAMYDDQRVYVDGVIRFVQDVDSGRF